MGTPTYRMTSLEAPHGIGARLSPVHFRGSTARRVSCYALLGGWLLLSLPPRCLSRGTPFRLTLRRSLGALTVVSVVPVSAQGLTPRRPSPAFYGGTAFGVGQRAVPLLERSTLHPWLYHGAYLRQGWPGAPLRWEPAITELDWSFAPRPSSEERSVPQHPCGPPLGIRRASPWPGLDRSVSGFSPAAPGPFRPSPSRIQRCGPFAFATPTPLGLNSPRGRAPRAVLQDVPCDPDLSPSYSLVA